MKSCIGPLTLCGLLLAACGNDGLESDPELQPPEDTDVYDPSDGQGEGGGYYGTGGPAPDPETGADGTGTGDTGADETGTDETGTGGTGSGLDCEEVDRLCQHEFALPDDGYDQVDVMGSFAPDGWETGVPMSLDGDTWRASIRLSWGDPTEYRFRIDGSEDWVLDPANDQMQGDNSVVAAAMCEDFSC